MVEMNYQVEVGVMVGCDEIDNMSYTITTASSEDHAMQLAIQYAKQDYPDAGFNICSCFEVLK